MKRTYFIIAAALLLSLFLYLFFRTEKTVVNELFIAFFSREKYETLTAFFRQHLPLNKHVVFSLPEGLWVFSITLASKGLWLRIGKLHFDCVFFPLFFSIGLEIFQLMHFTNGQFDWWDIGISICAWAAANYLLKARCTEQNIFHPFSGRSLLCLVCYAIVFLAHVWK